MAETPEFISTQVRDSEYFFLDLSPDPGAEFVVTCGGLEYCRRNYVMDRQKFDFFGMEYILTGRCRLAYGKQVFDLQAGSIFCYGPETRHRIEAVGEGRLAKYFIDFTGTAAESLLGEIFPDDPKPFQISNLRFMGELFRQLLETGRRGGRGAQKISRLILELIISEVSENAVSLDYHQTQSHATYERCLAYLENHYPAILSVNDLAEACNLSTGYLSRVFKRFSDESPSAVILRLKMNRAAELLLQGKMLVKEVSGLVGIDDPYHFSRLFKQYFGTSPKSFRDTFFKS